MKNSDHGYTKITPLAESNVRSLLIVLILVSSKLVSFGQCYEVEIEKTANSHPEVCRIAGSTVYGKKVLEFKPSKPGQSLDIFKETDKIEWHKFNYLVVDVIQKAEYSGIIYIDFYKKGGVAERSIVQQGGQESKAQITPKIGILPNLRTQVVFPLSYLDGQNIFLERSPRQLKGTVLGRRLEKEDIGLVRLRIDPVSPPHFKAHVEIASIRLTTELPPPLPKTVAVVDEFGQWREKNWPGKVTSEKDLTRKLKRLLSESEGNEFPDEWSRFGGFKRLRFNATGFFRTHHDGKRWWLVDPEGYAFVSAGVTCIRPTISGPVGGIEDLFKWIPSHTDSKFKLAVSERNQVKVVDFFQTNWIRVFGDTWKSQWGILTKNLLKKYRINTIANWSDLELAKGAAIPYTIPLNNFPSTPTKLFRDFPDVFNPLYRDHSTQFARQLEPFKGDPYLIGYFLSNEPHWAFGEHFIAFEMFGTAQQSHSKTNFAMWLLNKYGSLDAFNKAWQMDLTDIEQLTSKTFKEPSEVTKEAMDDMKEFSGVLVDQYISIVCEEVKKVDPHHLNLGLRYAWISSELCYRAGAYFDVFSINGYNFPGPPETAEIARRSGKPIMIGEYHFGSTDKGLPASGIQGAVNQKARGVAYRHYLENGFARPEIVGLHYFQWNDQPIMGRFDGENYNIGLFDICNQPYEEVLNAGKQSHERMYKVATGETKPYSKVIEKVLPLFY